MTKGNLSRRGFLQRSLAGLAAAGLPLWYAREVVAADDKDTKKPGPNDRLTMGIVGSGDRFRGGLIYDVARHKKDIQIVACCDVDKNHREAAAQSVQKQFGGECTTCEDFRELCGRKDIDLVLVATPDHWHALAAICAMKNGKDVYCEKPLTLTVDEGK